MSEFIDGYLKRLHVMSLPTEKLAKLKYLFTQHIQNVAFENTYVLSRTPLIIEKDKLYEKVVQNKRGGFCFELNYLFWCLLNDLGFDVEIYGGAVYGKNNQLSEKNGHIFSVVTIDGHKYVADVAFAERSPDDVLPLIYDTEIKTGTSIYRYRKLPDGDVIYETKKKIVRDMVTGDTVEDEFGPVVDSWIWGYRFTPTPVHISVIQAPLKVFTTDVDNSIFLKGLYVSKAHPGGHASLHFDTFRVVEYVSESEIKRKKEVIKADQVDEYLEKYFDLLPTIGMILPNFEATKTK